MSKLQSFLDTNLTGNFSVGDFAKPNNKNRNNNNNSNVGVSRLAKLHQSVASSASTVINAATNALGKTVGGGKNSSSNPVVTGHAAAALKRGIRDSSDAVASSARALAQEARKEEAKAERKANRAEYGIAGAYAMKHDSGWNQLAVRGRVAGGGTYSSALGSALEDSKKVKNFKTGTMKGTVWDENTKTYTKIDASRDPSQLSKLQKTTLDFYLDSAPDVIRGVEDVKSRVFDIVSPRAKAWDTKTKKWDTKAKGLRDAAQNLEAVGDPNLEAKKLSDRAEKLEMKSEYRKNDLQSQAIFNKIRKVGQGTADVFTGVKDTVSEKSLAKTIQKKGLAGIERRNARLKYMFGDRSWKTKALSGHGTSFLQKRYAGLKRMEEKKNTKNYYKSLASFSESTLDHALGNFSENESIPMEEFSGVDGKAKEYQIMYDILNMDFESLDQKYLEQGLFSERKDFDETPADGIPVNHDDLIIADGELTLGDVLNKNFYEANATEKKFQEMVARGFSQEEQSDPYVQFLEKFSTNASNFAIR